MFSFSRMITSASVALAMASVSSVIAVPISKQASPLVARATIPTPAFVVYTDRFVSADVLPPVADLAVSSPQFSFLSHDLILRLSHRVGTSSLSPSSPPVEHSTRRVRLPRSLLMSVPQRRQSTPTRASASLRPRSVRPKSPPPRVSTPSALRPSSRSSSSTPVSTVLTSITRT